MDDCLSDMSTGTLALAKDRRTRLKCIHWKTDLPNRWKRVCLRPKTPNLGSVRGGKKLLIDLSLSLPAGRKL